MPAHRPLRGRVPVLLAIVVAVGLTLLAPATPAAAQARPTAGEDELVAGVGDSGGFHVLVANGSESQAPRWSTVATLRVPGLDAGAWTGNLCVTGSGRHVVVVYAPAVWANRQPLAQAGAFVAVVDLRSGAVRQVAAGVALVYFSPGCGQGEEALLTRSVGRDERRTELLRVDAPTARVLHTARVSAQLALPAPAADGDYAVVGSRVVKVQPDGALSEVASVGGRPVALRATAGGALDLLTVAGDRTQALRWQGGRLRRLGDAAVGGLQLLGLRGGRSVLVGRLEHAATAGLPDLAVLASDRRVDAVSQQGSLLAQELLPRELEQSVRQGPDAAPADPEGRVQVRVLATRSGATHQTEIKVTAPAPPRAQAEPVPNTTNPVCAVPRNDPARQALQPTARMVEWAVDRAIKGALTVRPRGASPLLNTPQGMFPLKGLKGGGQIPAQVVLGILAQESNFRQASFRARPGDGGNPNIGNYYGFVNDIDHVNFDLADCGYGIAQVTTGMTKAPGGPFNQTQKNVIATHYAYNIAAGLRILEDKWNQAFDMGLRMNSGDPAAIENWYLALWAYNSGLHPNTGSGDWGIGWFNNPANPRYPADRKPFLRETLEDAKTPQKWPYQEKVLGWIETPQRTYFGQPSYPEANPDSNLSIPGQMTFCRPDVNNCNPANVSNPCPADSSACWWDRPASWTDCTFSCHRERLSFASNAAEPAMTAQYQPVCSSPMPPGTAIVDNVPNSSLNVVGCPGVASAGSFSLKVGRDPIDGAPIGDIDLHQLGAAYGGHLWFTHTYNASQMPHEVVGTWTPPSTVTRGWTRIKVHVPDHGGKTKQADYRIHLGNGEERHRVVNQYWFINDPLRAAANHWIDIGVFNLRPGAKVTLSNITLDGGGDVSIAYDAIAFIPTTKPAVSYVAMGDSFSAGEGLQPYDNNSDFPDEDEQGKDACHRSAAAYPRKLRLPGHSQTIEQESKAGAGTTDFHFIACSGAITTSVSMDAVDGAPSGENTDWGRVDWRFGELPQAVQGYLDADTTLVTLSVGGNDARFADVLSACIITNEQCSDPGYRMRRLSNGRLDPAPLRTYEEHVILDLLPAKLEATYREIHAMAPNARIIVLGYPQLFPSPPDEGGCFTISEADQVMLHRFGSALTVATANAVARVRNAGVRIDFVDPTATWVGGGHELCGTGDDWVNGILPLSRSNSGTATPGSGSFHPKTAGQDSFANLINQQLAS